MEKLGKSRFSENIQGIFKGIIVSIVLTLILLLIFATLLTYTGIQENTIKPVIIIISGISVLMGSSISTLKIKKNGMLNGGLVGLIYSLIIYLLSSTAGAGFELNFYSIIMIIICSVLGIIGGIIGINLK